MAKQHMDVLEMYVVCACACIRVYVYESRWVDALEVCECIVCVLRSHLFIDY